MKSLTSRISGFTLIEIMIAIVIVAILTAIAYPSYTKFIRESRLQAGMRVLENIALAQQRYFLVKRTYADNLEDLQIIDVPANVKDDFIPNIIFSFPSSSETISDSSIFLDPTISNTKANWIAVLHPRTNSLVDRYASPAIDGDGNQWMEIDKTCGANWETRCCRYGRSGSGSTATCATPSTAQTTPCERITWKDWLRYKPDLKAMGC